MGKSWRVASKTGFDGLKLQEEQHQHVGGHDWVGGDLDTWGVVKLEAASLNFRYLMVAKVRLIFPETSRWSIDSDDRAHTHSRWQKMSYQAQRVPGR